MVWRKRRRAKRGWTHAAAAAAVVVAVAVAVVVFVVADAVVALICRTVTSAWPLHQTRICG